MTLGCTGPPNGSERAYLFFHLFMLAIVPHAAYVFHSLEYWKLAQPVPWDDCAYLFRGMLAVNQLNQSADIWSFVSNIGSLAMHAPIGDSFAFWGLLVTSGKSYGPYLFLGGLLVGFQSIVATTVRLPKAARFAFGGGCLAIPFVFNMSFFLKSDFVCGLCFFCLLYALFVYDGCFRKRYVLAASVLVLLAKPTGIYLPFALLYVVVVRALGSEVRKQGLSRIWAGRWGSVQMLAHAAKNDVFLVLFSFAAFVVLIGPWLGHYYAYIVNNVFNPNFGWIESYSLLDAFLFYLPWGRGVIYWGNSFIPLAGCLVASLVVVAVKDRGRLFDFLIVCSIPFVCWIPIGVAPVKNPIFGSLFYYSILFASFYGLVQVSGVVNSKKVVVFLAVVVFALPSILLFKGLPVSPYSKHEKAELNEIASNIADTIIEQDATSLACVVSPTSIPTAYIRYLVAKKSGRTLPVYVYNWPAAQDLRKILSQGEVVLAMSKPEARRTKVRSMALAEKTYQVLREDSAYEVVLNESFQESSFVLFKRKKKREE